MQKRYYRFLAALALILGAPVLTALAQPNLVISEFVAVNDAGLTDEDGELSDWVEIYNPTLTPVNLGGWFLTDARTNLRKWQFPATNLPPYSYILVFASGKNRRVPGAPLHSNFRLDGGGEYLGLVYTNGTTIVSEYAPRYPDQNQVNSFGFGMLPTPTTFLVPTGVTSKLLIPTGDIGLGWTQVGFNDGTWQNAVTGIGYDTSTNYDGAIATDIGTQMQGTASSAYLRLPFNVADPSQFQELQLNLRYDDGFIAYLNGMEVARRNAPANATWNSVATALHGSEPGVAGLLEADFDTVTNAYTSSHFEGTTGQTTGPATIQSAGAGSTGRFLRLITDGVNYQGNAIAFNRTATGTYPLINADFDFRITSTDDPADGFAFMLIPTSTFGASGPGAFNSYSGIEEPNFPNVFSVGFDLYPHSSQNDVSLHWNGSEILNFTIPRSTIELVSGSFHRCSVQILYVTGGARVTVTITPNVNGTPGTPLTVINEVFIPNMPQYECRAEFAGRSGGLNMSVDLDNIEVRFGHPTGMVPMESFDISSAVTSLQPGANILAIHGLNADATSPDFLLVPQLAARGVVVQTNQLYFAQPTPGALNQGGAAAIAPEPVFSTPGGVHTSNVVVQLSAPVPGATIYYTVDGSIPTEQSIAYTAPIQITNSVLLVAKTFAPGYTPSIPLSQSYTILDPNVTAFSTKLPIVIVDSFNATINQDMPVRPPANITIIDSGATGRATLTGRPDFHGRITVEGRGQTSWGFNKKPLNIEFVDDFGRDRDASFLNFPEASDFALLSVWNDKTFLNDYLAYVLHEEMGHYSMRRRFVEVFFNGNYPGPVSGTAPNPGKVGTNDYVGIYLLLEKPRIDENRVNIAKLEPEDNAEPEITGGYIWKKDKNSPSDVNFALPNQPINAGDALKFHDPRPEQLTPAQRAWLVNHLTEFEQVLYSPNWRDPINGYAKYIDVDSFVDQHWIVEFTKQIDGYRLSNYMYKDRGGKIRMEPIWDWNLSFGNANYLDGGLTNGWYYPLISEQQHIWLRRLIAGPSSAPRGGDPEFLQEISDRWGELRTSTFNIDKLLAQVDGLTNYLFEAAIRDFARFPRLGTYLWPNPDGPNRSSADGTTLNWHVDYTTPTSYGAIIAELKKWLVGRFAWIDQQFLPSPTLSRNGGPYSVPLAIHSTGGTVYYTTNGSDPRLPGGGISPLAMAYTNYITLPANARVVARAYSPNTNLWTQWSAAVRGEFGYATPSLAVTELMFHPQAGNTNFNDEDFEFIELMNTTGQAIDLTGMRLAGGIDFVFPPGPMALVGTATSNNFDTTGTPYQSRILGAGGGPTLGTGGPAGNFLSLIQQTSNTNRNRIAFNQTATGSYDKIVADFDFRGNNATVLDPPGTPILQDFEGAGGTPYVIQPAAGVVNSPAVVTNGPNGSFMRITPPVNSLGNAVYFDRTDTGVYNTVLASFDFRITPGAGRADGMGIAFLNTATHGASGVTAGAFSEEPNIPGAIGVGFDIYQNVGGAGEVNNNHVTLHWNGSLVNVPSVVPGFDLASSQFHRADLIMRFRGGKAYVTVRITPNFYAGNSVAQTMFDNVEINNVTPYNARLAIAARTGGENAAHDVDSVNVQFLNTPEPGGVSLVLLPTSVFGTSGIGTGTSNYLDKPTFPNGFGLSFDMSPEVSVNDISLQWNGATRAGAYLSPATLNLDSGVFHRAHMELERMQDGVSAVVTLTPDIYGTPGDPITVITNVVIPGMPLSNFRVELAGRSGGCNLALDIDDVNVRFLQNTPNYLQAGERIVLVNDLAAFASRYGASIPVAGEYVGELANNGESIRILGSFGEPILEFNYSDNWFRLSDGPGFSLVMTNPTATADAWNLPGNWRIGQANGTPGAGDAAPPTIPVVVINEVLSHSDTNLQAGVQDAVELHNPTSGEVDISGWYLTDNFGVPQKYRIPANTRIAAGGYLVINETAFNTPTPTNIAFGLSAEGDEIYLFSANTSGELTGYYHGFDFGPAPANITFGRHLISTGDDHFVRQAQPTLGAQNSGPAVGPLVITEVMYHPVETGTGQDNDLDEYIELVNLSTSPVRLWDDNHPENTWRLTDAVGYSFPANTEIPAGATILVVSFDPVLEPALLDAFRTKYGVPTQVAVFGPFTGKLDNSADRIELRQPGEVDPNTLDAVYPLLERISYLDNAPWPVGADGIGLALQRRVPAQYGNDPGNWAAGQPTPGLAWTSGVAPVITAQPVSLTVPAFSSPSFAVAATASQPLSYQWRHNNNNIPGATNATLQLPYVTLQQAGDYQAVVYTVNSAAESAIAHLTVLQGAMIITNPVTRSVILRNEILTNTATFTVAALGNGPVTYQWLFNGQAITGATGQVLTVTNIGLPQAGIYSVNVTDAIGTVQSMPAELLVHVPPRYVRQPQSAILPVGSDYVLSTEATGTHPMTYRWRQRSTYLVTNIIDSNTDSYTVSNVQPAHAGAFSVIVSNPGGPATGAGSQGLSSNAFLVVVVPPSNQVVAPGTNVTLTASATGVHTNSLKYQWSYNGNDLTGETQPTLTLNNIQPAQSGQYSLAIQVLTNVPVTPASFTANVIVSDNPTRDTDGDGLTDAQELIAGTDPNDANSVLQIDITYTSAPVLIFNAVANKSYTVEYKQTLTTNTAWLKFTDVAAQPTNRTVTLPDSSGGANRFYRLVTPQR